jgi:hypothetical protein
MSLPYVDGATCFITQQILVLIIDNLAFVGHTQNEKSHITVTVLGGIQYFEKQLPKDG